MLRSGAIDEGPKPLWYISLCRVNLDREQDKGVFSLWGVDVEFGFLQCFDEVEESAECQFLEGHTLQLIYLLSD